MVDSHPFSPWGGLAGACTHSLTGVGRVWGHGGLDSWRTQLCHSSVNMCFEPEEQKLLKKGGRLMCPTL